MGKYCDYNNAEWVRRFNKLKNSDYETEIIGNTMYIISRGNFPVPVYKKFIGNFYRLTNETKERGERIICHLEMSKMHEKTLLEVLNSFGFNFDK